MKTYNSLKALLAILIVGSLTANIMQAMSGGRLVNPNPRRGSVPTVITAEEQVQMLRDELAQVKQELADTQERLAEYQRKATRQTMERGETTSNANAMWRKRVTAPEEPAEVSATRAEYSPSREVLESIY